MSENPSSVAVSREVTAQEESSRGWTATGLSAFGALAMTSCCILPLVLISFGVTGVFIGQMTALYQYKWITFALSAGFLAYGFWKAYRPVAASDCAAGTCARPVDRRLMRGILWTAAVVTLVALVFPYISPYFLKF